MVHSAVVEHEDSFIFLGGWTGTFANWEVYQYSAADGQWQKLPEESRLSEQKYGMTAMRVERSSFPSC